MVRHKIVWSHKAKIKLSEILDFYYQRNKSKTYPVKLYREFQKSIKLIVRQPMLGLKTDRELIRALIIGDYIIFYEINNDQIIIHTLWDCRQNPNDLIIK